ncbi:hypothetical protein DFH28DRAFT_902849 [Melampsora americana]|nr:hypothetical protein DFH28DRAFT_902849 [Melampsora americana]
MLQLLKKSPIYQYHALQIIIHSLLCYHSNVCMSVELASMARPTTCTPSTSGGNLNADDVEMFTYWKVMESHVVGEPSVIMQIKPESIQSASCETSEAGQGIRYSDDFEYFSKEIPGLRSSDAKHPLLMRSISNMLAVPKTVWSQNLRFMCERFYTRGIEPDPNEQLALLQALHRFAKLCKMPVQATQTVLSALAKMELYATEDVKMIWFPQHQKTEELYVRQMIAHIDLLSIYDSNYAKFTRDQFELGDYGVRLKTKFGERCGKDLFIFWVSRKSQKNNKKQWKLESDK